MEEIKSQKRVIRSAPGRLALVGNPFDIYGGSTISLTLKDMRSYVCVEQNGTKNQEISSKFYRPGKNRNQPENELEHAVIEELDLQYDYFKLFDVSDMPYETGFARSTAAVVAMIRAFNQLFDLGIKDNNDVAELAWRIERKLGVCGGQERYAIAHDDDELDQETLENRVQNKEIPPIEKIKDARAGKLFFMDFPGRENHRFDNQNYALVHELTLPNMNIAAAYANFTQSSFSYHQILREIFRNSDVGRRIILEYRDESHLVTRQALGECLSKNPSIQTFGQCMAESLNLRFKMFQELERKGTGFKYNEIIQETQKMRDILAANGAYGINQPGSKSIVFLYDDTTPILALQKAGYHTIKLGKE